MQTRKAHRHHRINSTSTASAAPGSVSQQTQLNTLNNALAALGLSAADIRQIDRVASLINDFNPTAFTSLAYQLEAQAQNSTAPSASAQNTQPAIVGASTRRRTSSLDRQPLRPHAALQSFSSSSQSGSNGQSAQAQAQKVTTAAQSRAKSSGRNGVSAFTSDQKSRGTVIGHRVSVLDLAASIS